MERFTQRSNKGKAVCRCKTAYSLVHCTEIVGGEAIEYFAELEDKLESGQLKEIRQIAEAFNKAVENEQPLVTVPSNDLKNEIINLKCERNDWKQRAESAAQRYDSIIQSSAECASTKIQNVLQDLYNHAKHGAQDGDNGFALACNQMKTKILAKAKQYGVEIEV